MTIETALRPMAEPLQLAARDVESLVVMAGQLEALIADLMADAGPVSPELAMRAQTADLLTQRLAGLKAFLKALAKASPPDARIDVAGAVAGLMLAEQAHRLGARPQLVPEDVAGGDLTLFDV
jgi:hypothetical protein